MSEHIQSFGSTVPFAEPAWYNTHTSPYYNDSHKRLRAYVREYVETYLIPNAEEWELSGKVPSEVFRRHAELGFVAACIFPMPAKYMEAGPGYKSQKLPADIPPSEWDFFHDFILVDELSRVGYIGVLWSLISGNSIGVPPIVNFGTDEQKKQFLPGVLRGEIRGCLGITEPDAGSDVANVRTTATLSPDGKYFVVNGSKKWITNALWSDFVVAAVRTGSEESGAAGLSALIIPLNSPGVSRRHLHNSGVLASGSTFIEFDEVQVPRENLLGGETGFGKGFKMVLSNFNHERLTMAVQCLRLSRICVQDAYTYAEKRIVFGKPLLSNQVIRSKLSNMSMLTESIQSHLETLLHHASTTPGALDNSMGGEMARVKVHSSRMLEFCVREAQQILGGVGYSRGGRGGRVEQISRDVRVFVVGGGSDEILTDLAIRQAIAADKARHKSTNSNL